MTAIATTPSARRLLPTPQPPASPFPYHPGSLLSINDLSIDDISHLLFRATVLENLDPLKRDRRYDDAGNPVSRAPLIERVSEQGEPEPLPKV